MSAIANSLPYAVAIVLSAAPVLALVLVLVTSKPQRVSAMFLLGWAVGILATAGVLVGLVDLSLRPRLPETAGAIVKIGLGATLAILTLNAWWRGSDRASEPTWLTNIRRWSPSRAFAVGFGLASINPKTLVLVASGATAILESSASLREEAISVTVFAIIASVGIATPIVLRELGGAAINRGLERASRWMTAHGTTLSTFVLAIIAVVLISKGISVLSAS